MFGTVAQWILEMRRTLGILFILCYINSTHGAIHIAQQAFNSATRGKPPWAARHFHYGRTLRSGRGAGGAAGGSGLVNLSQSQSLPGDALGLRGAGCDALGARAHDLCLRLAPMLRRAARSWRTPGRRVGQKQPQRCAPRSWSNCGSLLRALGRHFPSELVRWPVDRDPLRAFLLQSSNQAATGSAPRCG